MKTYKLSTGILFTSVPEKRQFYVLINKMPKTLPDVKPDSGSKDKHFLNYNKKEG